MRGILHICGALLALTSLAIAEPYEVTYYPPGSPYADGQDPAGPFPEDQGWVKYAGPADIVQRSIDDGTLLLESHEMGDYETYSAEMGGTLNPGPGEYLYLEWQMIVDQESLFGDTIAGAALDDFGGDFTLSIGIDHVRDLSGFEWYWYDPGVFHTFAVISVDLVDYHLFVDGDYAFSDVFKRPTSLDSFVNWGTGSSSSFSTSRWAYFRFGSARLGDLDTDGRIDLNDYATFAVCFTGAGTTNVPVGCSDRDSALADLDADGDVDLGDFATFAVNFTA